MGRLDGRCAIVTGGARGIGRHYATALAAEGAAVMIADIVDGSDLAEELAAKHGRNATASMICDVSDEAQIKALVAKTVERFGKIDILVNNAALYSQLEETEFTKIDVALWDKVMAVNVRGPFLMAKHVVPHMRAKGYGKIINIGSGIDVPRHAADAALHHVEGRDRRVHALALARGRHVRHLREHAGAGLHALRQRGREQSRPRRRPRATTPSSAAPSSATAIRRTSWARWCSWRRATAISSPAR